MDTTTIINTVISSTADSLTNRVNEQVSNTTTNFNMNNNDLVNERGSILKAMNANHIYKKEQIEKYTKFSRFGYFDPYDANTNTREYIFFTKPDLHLYEEDGTTLNPELSAITFFQTADLNFPKSMKQLQWSIRDQDANNSFCNLLTNTVSSKLGLDDIAMENLESASNIAGTRLHYPLGTTTSNNIVDFSLEFTDTKYLDVYMFFRIWYQYELEKAGGIITPPSRDYTINKIAHNLSSCYKIVVGEDGETIVYWAKFWGVYPTSIPRSAFSEIPNDKITIPVSFKAQWVDDMDYSILDDFNLVVSEKLNSISGGDIPIYDSSIHAVSGEWCNCPYIVSHVQSDNRHVFKLKWR